MRPQPETIRLGDREWRVRPLTLAQVQAIEPVLMETSTKKSNVAAAISIVAIALSRDHAAAVDTLSDIEATATEISRAMTSVLRLGGFIEADPDDVPSGAARKGEDSLGETQADVTKLDPSASISISSTRD